MSSPAPATGAWSVRVARLAANLRNDVVLVAIDVALVAAAYFAVLVMRFEGAVPETWLADFVRFLPVAIVAHLASLSVAGAYGAMWRHAGVAEARNVLAGGALATGLLTVPTALRALPVPLSVVVVGGALATCLMAVQRFHSRLFALRRDSARAPTRVVVVGAGEAGAGVVREMIRVPGQGLRPVAVLDDDTRTHGRRIAGVPVAGRIERLPEVADRQGADQALLAIPSADRALIRRVADLAEQAGLTLKVLPRVNELMEGHARVADARDIAIEELLGREPVATDAETVRGALEGKRVLVVGAGGSIGSEIARQVDGLDPEKLVLLDNDETHLFEVEATVSAGADMVLADVRDSEGIKALFAETCPDVVFHAAAHKQVPLLERHPCEATRTNVLGTWNVLDAARDVGVPRLVFISTDKAVRPSSVMGASKRVAEQLVRSFAPEGAAWCAVRFGNVLGSRGSVVPTFVRQIRAGGPVTVTSPHMTRYFMSIPEAVELVLQSGAMAEGDEIFMLDMGEPVRILDLAERMIRLAGQRPGTDVPIRITGTRPGEKLSEELAEPEVVPTPTAHPDITALHPPQLPSVTLVEGLNALRFHALRRDEAASATTLLRLAHACGGQEPHQMAGLETGG